VRRALAHAVALAFVVHSALAGEPFTGRIEATVTRGTEQTRLLYTIGADALRLEVLEAKTPTPVDLVDLKSGVLTIVFPHNSSFMRARRGSVAPRPGPPTPPAMPSGVPTTAGPPTMPAMPPPPMSGATWKTTGRKEKILGYDCERYEVSARGETAEIWATAALVPFQNYQRDPSPHPGPLQLEEEWTAQLTAKKLFPLRVVLHDETPDERFRFEVTALKPLKIIEKGAFQPPADSIEVPLPPL